MTRARVRQLLLLGNGLVFLLIALAALAVPRLVAPRYALTLPGVDAMNQFRAVYVGFWSGLFVLFATAARRIEDRRLGNLAAILVLCQATARLLSWALDGIPSAPFVGAACGELVSAIAILAL